MLQGRKKEIRQQLIGFYRSYQNDGEPICQRERVSDIVLEQRIDGDTESA